MDPSSYTNLTRTCPWCADVTVIAFSEEGLIRALSRHLEQCMGERLDDEAAS